jgi:hypothetical protein
MRGADAVVFLKLNARTHGNGFLTAADVNAANNLSLPIELSLDARLFGRREVVIPDRADARS